MALQIITDSTCDLTVLEMKEMGIVSLPLTVRFGSEEYRDGVDLTSEEFFYKLEASDALPTTSQVPPGAFMEQFSKCLSEGKEVLGIFISAGLSGTYQSAQVAKQYLGHDERIHLVDSKSVSFGTVLLLQHAVKLRDAGQSAAQIKQALDRITPRLSFYGIVSTLKYLQKGGRLSRTTQMLGTALRLKPIMGLRDGVVAAYGKAQGMAGAFRQLAKILQKEPPDPSFGYSVAHARAASLLPAFVQTLETAVPIVPVRYCEIGSVIGTHTGPGGVGLAYVRAK